MHHFLAHAQRLRFARVLIGQHARVHVQPRDLFLQRGLALEGVGQRLR